jgi:hypothetical protein
MYFFMLMVNGCMEPRQPYNYGLNDSFLQCMHELISGFKYEFDL